MTASVVPASLAQWLFPVEALKNTPSVASGFYPLERELYDRARGVEFLFRLGSSLGLSVPYLALSNYSAHYSASLLHHHASVQTDCGAHDGSDMVS